MSNNKPKRRKLKAGQIILADSFAGVRVKKRLTRSDDHGWWGVLIDPADAKALQKMSVPWIEPETEETFTFDFHIVKVIRKPLKENPVNAKRDVRKQKRKKRKPRNRTVRKSS
tara:strand:- start:9280 stop:9618 length:339 start_codon:yes stop_codon:yes gene_type:complete